MQFYISHSDDKNNDYYKGGVAPTLQIKEVSRCPNQIKTCDYIQLIHFLKLLMDDYPLMVLKCQCHVRGPF